MSPKKIDKVLIFDSGVLISFSMNGMLEVIESLKKNFSGKFIVTHDVRREIVDTPLHIKKFELEALKIKSLIDSGVLELPSALGVSEDEIEAEDQMMLNIANSTFSGKGKDIHLLDHGEASCLALSKILTDRGIQNIIAVDERTTRLLAERPENLKKIMESRLETKIVVNSKNLPMFKDFKIVRSTELAYVAYKKGLLDIKDKLVLDALLYALKFKGAAVSGEEIEAIKKLS